MSLKLLGFSGKALHGKDTCARIAREIAEEELGLEMGQWAFAYLLKALVYAEADHQFSLEDVFYNKPAEVRERLQLRGTEEGRDKYGEDLWLLGTAAMLHILENTTKLQGVTITDVRFPNEVSFVRLGGVTAQSIFFTKLAEVLDATEYDSLEDTIFTDPDALAKSLALEDKAINAAKAVLEDELAKAKGMVLYIKSDRPTLTGEAASHPSEIALDWIPSSRFDGIITNNLDTTFEDLRNQLRPFVYKLFDRGADE